MSNPIVQVNVSIQSAPSSSKLQKNGAFISTGGTITSPGTKSVLTQLSDLTPLLSQPAALNNLAWAGGTVTATASSPHGLPVGQVVNLTIAGASPSGYNGTLQCTAISPTSFTYSLINNPGGMITAGTWVNADASSLLQRATTFFAQGASQQVSVLEVGPSDAAHGVSFLSSWITQNPGTFYSYLVPRFWDASSSFLSFLGNFTATSAKTYFFVTTTLQNYALYAGLKDVVWLIEAPAYGVWSANSLLSLSWATGVATGSTTTNHGISVGQWFQLSGSSPPGWNGWFQAQPGTTGTTLVFNISTNPGANTVLGTLVASFFSSAGIGASEFSLAGLFRITLNYAPSSTNKVTPLNYAYLFGVTAFPTQGNASLINTILAANGNIVGTGAAGGNSNFVVQGGTTADGNPWKYWYSVDYIQINLALNLTAAIINGANNPSNPVDYNQFGINTLQRAAVTTMANGISSGLVLNAIQQTKLSAADLATALNLGTYAANTLVNADPFGSYTTENPNDYGNGVYNGISIVYTPLRGFQSILVNVTVSSFTG